MAGFSIQDAALSGFAAVRTHPRALLVWTPFAFLLSVLTQVLFIRLGGQEVDWSVLSQDPAQITAIAEKMLPVSAAFMAIGLVTNAIIQAAMMRLMLRPSASRFGYVRLGADELRQLGLGLVALAVVVGGYLICAVVVSVVAGALLTVAKPLGVLAFTAGLTGAIVALIAVGVRLSLAIPLTFASARVDLFGSWRLTRGLFWPILGTYVLVVVLFLVVRVFATILIFGLGGLALGHEMAALEAMPTSIAECFTPLRLIMALFGAFVTALTWPVVITPSARIYQSLSPATGPGPHIWG